jgi:hypothetical protein
MVGDNDNGAEPVNEGGARETFKNSRSHDRNLTARLADRPAWV